MSDEKPKTRKPGGYARVEFIKNIDEIAKLLSEGHTISSAYRILSESGKITMTLRHFHNLCNPKESSKKDNK